MAAGLGAGLAEIGEQRLAAAFRRLGEREQGGEAGALERLRGSGASLSSIWRRRSFMSSKP